MRKRTKNRKFSRSSDQRSALIRGLAISLIEHGKIHTTEAKARQLRPYVEKIVTRGKIDTVAARRVVSATLGQPKADLVKKIFNELGKKYADRKGGYTRIVKLGDTPAGRREAYIEFV